MLLVRSFSLTDSLLTMTPLSFILTMTPYSVYHVEQGWATFLLLPAALRLLPESTADSKLKTFVLR